MVDTVELRTLGTVVKTTYEDNPDTNAYTDDEKAKLAGISAQATKNGSDATLLARTNHTGSQAMSTVTGLAAALDTKLDKVVGKELSDNNYTSAEKEKLAGMDAEATKNSTDAFLLARANHTGTQAIATVTGLQTALDTKVDKVDGKELSDNNYTDAEKTKLAGLEGPHFKGTYTSLAALQGAGIDAVAGDYADVDGGSGLETFRCIWDVSNQEWVQQLGASTQLTGAQIKSEYEAQPDTNAFTDAEKAKLTGIDAEATKNSSDAFLLSRANHTGTQAISTVTGLQTALNGKINVDGSKVLSDNNYTSDEKTKLASVASEATKNSTDAVLLSRANHTGTQAIATVTGLQTALDGKVSVDGSKVLSDNNYTQAEKAKLTSIATSTGNNFTWRYKGNWNASTNSPSLSNGSGVEGDMYVVTVGASRTFGGVIYNFLVNDFIVYVNGGWRRFTSNSIDYKPRGTISPPIPALYALRSTSNNSYPRIVETRITNWVSQYDQFSILGSNGIITPPSWASHIRIRANVSFSGSETAAVRFGSYIYRNNAIISNDAEYITNFNGPNSTPSTAIIPISPGDNFNIAVWHAFEANKELNSWTWLSVELFEAI